MIETRRRLTQLPIAPEEGWLSLLLVGLMMFVMAASIDDAGWVIGNSDLTNFLVIAALLGVLAGFVGAKAGWNRWVANLVGAAFAALIVPILVGEVLRPGAGLAWQYAATADAMVGAWTDLIVNKLQLTRQIGHHLLILGLLVWGTGQFAASAVFRHRRPLSAVVVIGAILVANMAATLHDQLGFLILFSLAALFLLIRLHALDEQATWSRRRIGDPSAVRTIYLRGGTVFIVVAILGSLALTASATSAPLAGAWDSVKPWLLDVSAAIERFLPTLESSRGIGGIQFGPSAPIRGSWTTDGGLAATIQRVPGDTFPYYWRAVAYDEFTNTGWRWSEDPVQVPRATDTELLADTFDRVAPPGTQDITFTVVPDQLRGSYVLSPLSPLTVNRDSTLLGLGKEGFYQAVEVPNAHDPYSITARVPLTGDDKGGLTQNLLKAAGSGYPLDVLQRYTALPDGAVGPEAKKVLADVLQRMTATGIPDDPFDLSVALVHELQSSRFQYSANVLDINCGQLSTSECFATYRRGYCEHYATLMTVLLRSHGIPARFVEGFLPGEIDKRTGIEKILNSNAHAWVEVYFPGHGWYMFDPTGNGQDQTVPLPVGKPVASAPPSRFPSLPPDNDPEGPDGIRGSRDPSALPGVGRDGGVGPGGLVLITLVMLTAVAILGFLVWRRGPRGPVTPEGAWTGIGRLAARFGFGPRPTQTAYEYATALGEILPGIRPELQTVATAKVETAYGGRVLGDDRIRAIRDSYVKLRVALLRLLFRRRDRRRHKS
jgi:transglutaminase-like putative cysteine protease